MNFQKITRIAVCLLLVCCLLVNASPVKTSATAVVVPTVAATAVAVPSAMVIGSILIGLGVLVAVDVIPWDNLVENCKSYLADVGFVNENGDIDIFYLTGSSIQFGVTQNLIEAVRAWLFDEEIIYYDASAFVSSLVQLKSGSYSRTLDQDVSIMEFWYDSAYSSNFDFIATCQYCLLYYRDHPTLSSYDGYYLYFIQSYPSTSISSGTTYYVVPSGSYYYNGSALPAYSTLLSAESTVTYDDYALYSFASSVAVADTLTAGEIATYDIALSDGYSVWAENVISIPSEDEENIPVWPLGLGSTYEDTRSYAQADVWAGVSSLVIDDAVTDTEEDTATVAPVDSIAGTVTNIWEFIQSIPQVILDAIKGGMSAVFIPSEGFVVELVQALAADYPLFGSGLDLMDTCLDALDVGTTTAPVIYIDLSAGEGSIFWGANTVLMDLSWYERYKPSVDAIMSAFLWAVFVFKLLTKLPGIIGGMPGDWIMDGLGHAGLIDYLPTRNMAYEVHRADLRSQVRAGPSASDEAIDEAFVEGYNEALSDIFLED